MSSGSFLAQNASTSLWDRSLLTVSGGNVTFNDMTDCTLINLSELNILSGHLTLNDAATLSAEFSSVEINGGDMSMKSYSVMLNQSVFVSS